MIQQLSTLDPNFNQQLNELLAFETVTDAALVHRVEQIIEQVKAEGDDAVLHLTQALDHHPATRFSDLVISQQQLKTAFDGLPPSLKQALELAASRIRDFHQKQVQGSWSYTDTLGNTLGQIVNPVEKAGIYVPGGKAAYPSSVLMNAIPAQVAGVPEIVMVFPAPRGEINPLILAAAWLSGVHKVFTIGGAQAVAALAYGTQSIPAVDKITGPGNRYVAAAKRAVFGQVGIDMIAGPSEILVYSEHQPDWPEQAKWLAMDLLSQAEHDEVAQAILISDSRQLLEDVKTWLEQHLSTLPRNEIARTSIANRGALIQVENRQQAIDLINRIAPEHLELAVNDADKLLPEIKNAGAIFMGRYTPEAIGDYCAGPNHVLPTSGTARFSSPLGVYDFQKRTSLIGCSQQGVRSLAAAADELAQQEGLDAHALSARFRYTDSQ